MFRVIGLVVVFAALAVLAVPVAAQQPAAPSPPNASAMVQIFVSKGYLTAEEAARIQQAPNQAEANDRMLRVFLAKGLLTQQEYNAASTQPAAETGANGTRMLNAAAPAGPTPATISPEPVPQPKMAEWPVTAMNVGYDPSDGASADASVIPAIAPVRVLPIGIPGDPKGIIPDVKLGSGAMLRAYGFLKASAIYDTTNSGGATAGSDDFPLPLLMGDTGPDAGSQFRFKARSSRAGVNFAWPINGPDLTLTGKVEVDFEGDYTTVANRSVSSIRSSQVSLRLAWARLDGKFNTVPWFVEFGQDWTLLGSSTQPDLFETTQAGAFFGSDYERVPQFKTGLQFSAGKLKVEPEFAITLSAFGDSGLNTSTTNSLFGSLGQIPTGFQDQTREGAVLGQASGQPGVEGRIVFDFPLNSSWQGVPNAEIIFSGGHDEAEEIVPVGNIPTTPVSTLTYATGATPVGLSATACTGAPAAGFSVRCYYPTGVTNDIPQNIFDVGIQLPTPWFTLITKYYRGGDMRYMFGGLLNTAFRDSSAGPMVTIPGGTILDCAVGSTGCSAAGTINLAQNVYSLAGDLFTFSAVGPAGAARAVYDPYRPIRGQGGFAQLGFPLSRIFGANPEGLNSGWTLYAGYGTDSAFNRDVVRANGNGLRRTDYVPVSLRYKINKWAQVVEEVTWYDTLVGSCTEFTAAASCENGLGKPVSGVLFRGIGARVNHDIRQEFGTIFTF